ncbi:1013_t:CDS:2 [Cetraspora pellucida]|uniref:1013_t:CDS:1 n=1 Tax=Cetraspora pellucida TaxID=1433469 RepID=A0ACA9M2A5_9GLOM|nr:1013_t:CDS:2 [Cetraspora pellucida]
MSSIVYVSFSDAYYFARSMKVCNLLGAEAWSSNILCSMIALKNTESVKYSRAYIIIPIKGFKNKRLVTGLDFSSLYPSLIITYNLSLDKIILSRKETINSIHHNNISEEKGLYARVLKNLFNKQKKMKKCLNELDEESFEYSCLDSKQKAVKLYINTFYSKHNIKFVKKFVEDKGFGVKYEDTHSLYLTYSEECFQECNRKYKLDQLSQKEKVDIVKRGQSKLFCDIDKKIINRTLKVDNEETKYQIVEKTKYSCEVLENQQLIKKGLPANKCLYKVFKFSKQFSYIVIISKEIYNNCRKKISQQKEDYMEYPNVIKKFNKKINIDYYIKSLFSFCACFINYDNKYQPLPESLSKVIDCKKKFKKKKLKIAKDLLQSNDSLSLEEDEIAKIKDEESQKLAKKWLKNYIKNLHDALKKDEAIIFYL